MFTQESFCLQGILDDINEQDTSFLDSKHKHMQKSGAPPEKFRVLPGLFPIEFNVLQVELISKSYQSLVPALISIFLEMVWVPLKDGMSLFRLTDGS